MGSVLSSAQLPRQFCAGQSGRWLSRTLRFGAERRERAGRRSLLVSLGGPLSDTPIDGRAGGRQLAGCVSREAASGCLVPSQVIAVPVAAPPPVRYDGGPHCCLSALAQSAEDGGPEATRRVFRKGNDVVVATLSAATAYPISILIRALVLVARMRVHVRMDPESAYHGLLGHEERYVFRPPVSRAEGPSPATP